MQEQEIARTLICERFTLGPSLAVTLAPLNNQCWARLEAVSGQAQILSQPYQAGSTLYSGVSGASLLYQFGTFPVYLPYKGALVVGALGATAVIQVS